jgi:chromate transport protein ChrA
MPRGFVTGGFVACLAALVGLRSATLSGAFLFGLLSAGSISILPNALVVVIPVWVYVGLEKRGQASWFRAVALGAALAGLLHAAVQYFYVTHPAASFLSGDQEGVLTSLLGAEAVTRVSSGLSSPGRFLSDVLPRPLGGPGGAAAAILVPPLLLWRARRYSGALASVVGGLSLVVALGLEKVQAGSDSIFYPWSRHFLPLPIALVLYLLWWEMGRQQTARERVRTGLAVALVVCAVGVVATEWRTIDAVVPQEVAVGQRHVIPARTDLVYRNCRLLEIDVRTTHAAIVLFPLSSNLPLNYACPAVLEEPFATLCPEYDRRAWLLETELARRPGQLLLYDFEWTVAERAMRRFGDVKFMRSRPSVLLVSVDDLSLAEALRGLRIKVRPH